MKLAHLPLILLPLLTWARLQPSPIENPESWSPHPDESPRAALVALVEESDLSDLEVSIRQLEESFNTRYQYPWVFFSTQPLGDNFRQVVSDATKAVCFYEVIAANNRSVDGSPDLASPAYCNRCPSHHGLDSFAKEGRMRDYEWFWRIEPGALFTQRIDFDVFRYIQDRGIAYGWLTGLQLYWLDDASSHLPEPGLLHAETDIPSLDGAADACDIVACTMPGLDGDHADNSMRLLSGSGIRRFEGSQKHPGNSDTDLKTKHADVVQHGAEECLGPGTELGSIAFFQSAGHEALIQDSLIQHCDSEPTDGLDHGRTDGFPVLGHRSMKSPPKQTMRTSYGATQGIKLKMPKPTPAPVIRVPLYHFVLSMEKHHSRWNQLYKDIMRQDLVPGLKSGNTVIDERNFTPYYKY